MSAELQKDAAKFLGFEELENLLEVHETTDLQEQLYRAKLAQESTLAQYQELYDHCENQAKEFAETLQSRQTTIDTLTTKNADLSSQITELTHVSKDSQAHALEAEQQLKLAHQQRDELTAQLDLLRTSAGNAQRRCDRATRLLPGILQSLQGMTGFIENLLEKAYSSPSAKDSLTPKAGQILVERLKGEIQSLKSLQSQLAEKRQ